MLNKAWKSFIVIIARHSRVESVKEEEPSSLAAIAIIRETVFGVAGTYNKATAEYIQAKLLW